MKIEIFYDFYYYLSKHHLKKMTLVYIIIFLILLFINTLSNLGLTAEANETIYIVRQIEYKLELKDPKYFKPGLKHRVIPKNIHKVYFKKLMNIYS